jgi:hypothetical protein
MHIVIRDEFKNVRSAEIGNAVDTVIVGSHPDCHVYLPDIRIANEHLRICRDPEGGWQLELGDIPEDTPAAFTRIFVNALEVANGTIVHHNDEILMATFALRVFTDDSDVHAPLASAMEDAAKIRAHPLPAGAIIRNEAEIETAIPVSRVREMTTFAFEMHDCPDLAALLAATITALAKRFHARLVWMGARRHGYGRMEYVESRLVDGRAGGDPPRLETYLFRCCERGQYVCCPSDDHDDVSARANGSRVEQALARAIGIGRRMADNGDDIAAGLGNMRDGIEITLDQMRAKQQILGRIAQHGELGENHQTRTGSGSPPHVLQDAFGVPGNIADHRVDLRKGDLHASVPGAICRKVVADLTQGCPKERGAAEHESEPRL